MVKEKYRENYDTVDEGSIGKIISLMEKKAKTSVVQKFLYTQSADHHSATITGCSFNYDQPTAHR
jgi:hypothetical protein